MANSVDGAGQGQGGAELRCIACSRVQERSTQNFRCSACGDLLEVEFPAWKALNGAPSATLSAAGLKALWLERRTSRLPEDQSGVWRFREILPELRPASAISLREGNTPLYDLPGCAGAAGLDQLFAKHQGMNPTGSFKDTGMTVAASFARQAGYRWVVCASTGNTSASMAAYASRGGMRSLVLVPDGKISWSKLSQALDYGALTCQLRTDFDGCMRVLNEIVQRMPIYVLNSVNPYRVEGQKTAAFELMEQRDWDTPDHILVPGGNLANVSALGKAFREMLSLGLIWRVPRISVIQAEGANPLVRMMRENGGTRLIPVEADTMATAIRIGSPASWRKAVRVLKEFGGVAEQVSEAEMALAKAEIGADGIGCEPASAVTLAGLKKLRNQGFVKRTDSVVLILTGHLLKDSEFTLKFHQDELLAGAEGEIEAQRRPPIVLDADADAVIAALERSEKDSDQAISQT